MTLRLASAPCTWGVWERTVDRDDLIPPDLMLKTVHELGYTGIELGPPGYSRRRTRRASLRTLEPYGLELVGAFAPLRIADEEGFREDLAFLDRTIAILAATGARGPSCSPATRTRSVSRAAGRPDARAATRRSPVTSSARAAERIGAGGASVPARPV